MKAVEEEVKKIDSYYHQLKYLDVGTRNSQDLVPNQRPAFPRGRNPRDYRIHSERRRSRPDQGSETAQEVCENNGE